ncbi:hypothetical protein [Caldicellulosiruptor changbaiensis]|nr:hypothetical protein [Caldicellulosiruptor changbaiensis]
MAFDFKITRNFSNARIKTYKSVKGNTSGNAASIKVDPSPAGR